MKTPMNTYRDIVLALEKGISVYWRNENYKVLPVFMSNNAVGSKNIIKLRITCLSNWFGSYLQEEDIRDCFVVK